MTLHVGRNQPCPCGSGRKFKNCCLAATTPAPVAAAPFATADRDSVLARLREFGSRAEFADTLQTSAATFRGECSFDCEHAHAHEAGVLGPWPSSEAFDAWFAFDVTMRGGRTLAALFLERHGSRLPRGERAYLERMRDSHLRAYQVTELTPDGRCRLIDLWTGDFVWVREPHDGRRLVRWDVLAARITRGPGGDLEIEGVPYLYPVRVRDALLRALHHAHGQRGRPVRPADVARFFKDVAITFHDFARVTVAGAAGPLPGAAFAAPRPFARAFFDVRDRVALVRTLARFPDTEPVGDDGEWLWLRDPLMFGRVLGRFMLDVEPVLVLETEVEGAVDYARQLLGHLAGNAVEFRAVERLGVQLPLGASVSFQGLFGAVPDRLYADR